MSTQILEKIKSRGYWHGVIRPSSFNPERIHSLKRLETLVEQYQVRHRGWYFPHYDLGYIKRGADFIGLAISFMHQNESWRFYQSGQFTYYIGLDEDWTDDAGAWLNMRLEPGSMLDILSALYHLSEVYEFTARLAEEGVFGELVSVKIKLAGLEGRKLFFWPGSGRHLFDGYTSHVSELSKETEMTVTDFLSKSRNLSLEHFLWIMERFGFDASESVFRQDQEKFFEGRY